MCIYIQLTFSANDAIIYTYYPESLMKIQLASDLHLEFADVDIKNTTGADVLILSGDILVADDLRNQPVSLSWEALPEEGHGRAKRSMRYRDFFQRVSFQFPHVIYIMGNHEHYHGKFDKSAAVIRETLGYLNIHNIHLLDRDAKEIDGVHFIGGTMWTDCNKGDPMTQYHLEHCMTDFRVIRIAGENFKKFLPMRTVIEFTKTRDYFKTVIDNLPKDSKIVVCSHHAPSHLSIHEIYKNDTLMNGGYSSDLSEFILDRPQIKAWTHGHMHNNFDYLVGDTRVMCNPHGYPGENDQFDFNFTFEV
jgi:Icc-related predicted phosphoesterase